MFAVCADSGKERMAHIHNAAGSQCYNIMQRCNILSAANTRCISRVLYANVKFGARRFVCRKSNSSNVSTDDTNSSNEKSSSKSPAVSVG
jgi:hypothetical protein